MLDVAIESTLRSPLIRSPRQVIVADDDSHDDTELVARQRGVTYVRVNNHNISRTRNAGLSLVQTPYVTFLDHDDAWLPGNMEPQLSALRDNPAAAFAYGIARCATADLEPLEWTFPWPPLASGIVPEKLHLDYPNLGAVLFTRGAVSDVGGFDPRVEYHQDADLLIRIAAHREIVGVNFVGLLHRGRTPSMVRSDYYWPHRVVLRWRPRNVGVGWRASLKLHHKLRGIWYQRFCEDAYASLQLGQRQDALECLRRAVYVSPARAVRHAPAVASLTWQCLRTRSAA